MAQIVDKIAVFLATEWRLDEFSDEIVRETIDGYFADFDMLFEYIQPSFLDRIDALDCIKTLTKYFINYELRSDSDEIWNSLTEAEVKIDRLYILLFYAIEKGLKNDAIFDAKKVAISAASNYLAICCVNGAKAHGVLNLYLYQRLLETIKLAVTLLSLESVNSSQNRKSKSNQSTSVKMSKSRSNLQESMETESLTVNQVEELDEMLHEFLCILFVFLGKVSLLGNDSSTTQTAKALHNLMQNLSKNDLDIVYLLVQNVCAKCPDRSEYRVKLASIVVQVLSLLPCDYHTQFINWLSDFSQEGKVSCRTICVELTPILISAIQRREIMGNDAVLRLEMTGILLTMLLSRSRDKAVTVRCRTLANLATIISPSFRDILVKIANDLISEEKKYKNVGISNEDITIVNADENGDQALIALIARRCVDEKALVRKVAIQTIESIYSIVDRQSRKIALKLIKDRTTDLALSVRKQSAESLTNILMCVKNSESEEEEGKEEERRFLHAFWLDSILPMGDDRESSVSQFVCKLVNDSLLVRRYFLRSLMHLVGEKQLDSRILAILDTNSRDSQKANVCWMLLADLSGVFDVNPKSARIRWYSLDVDDSVRVQGYMAKLFANTHKRMTVEDRQHLRQNMVEKLDSFQVDANGVKCLFYTVYCLFGVFDREKLSFWCKKLFDKCEKLLSNIVFIRTKGENCASVTSEEHLVRILATVGESVQYFPELINDRLFDIVAALFCNEMIQVELSRRMSRSGGDNDQVQDRVKKLAEEAEDMGGGSDRQLIGRTVRSHSLVTLGKLCLQHEPGAVRFVPLLARELRTNPDPVIRNNAVVVMADLCVRHTSLVDRHMGTLALALRDRSTLVRKQTLTLLTSLLKENFLRWRGELMHRFVSTLLDRDQSIRDFARLCLLDVLARQFPKMFVHYFVECLFHFNTVTHPAWSAAGDDANMIDIEPTDGDAFSLKGEEHFEDRMKLYRFMLSQFNDQDKFTMSVKISQDVFSAVIDGTIRFSDENVRQLIRDAIKLMFCAEIKLSISCRGKANEDDDFEEEEQQQQQVMDKVREMANKALKAGFRKATMNFILPNVMGLKEFLQKKRSPLLRDVLELIREYVKDYPEDLKLFFSGDVQLQAEVEFDLKRLNIMENAEKENKHKREVERLRIEKLTEKTPKTAIDNDGEKTSEREKNNDGINNEMEQNGRENGHIGEENDENDQDCEDIHHGDQELHDQSRMSPNLATRAISTPQLCHQPPDVTFQLGNEFDLINSPKIASQMAKKPKRSKRIRKSPDIDSIQEDE